MPSAEHRLLRFAREADRRAPEAAPQGPAERADVRDAKGAVQDALQRMDAVDTKGDETMFAIRKDAEKRFAQDRQQLATIDAQEDALRARLHMMIEGYNKA